eukprot:865009-Lingulodinium_polyedra.AAC.1
MIVNIPKSRDHTQGLMIWGSGQNGSYKLPAKGMYMRDFLPLYDFMYDGAGRRLDSFDITVEPDWTFHLGWFNLLENPDKTINTFRKYGSTEVKALPHSITIAQAYDARMTH